MVFLIQPVRSLFFFFLPFLDCFVSVGLSAMKGKIVIGGGGGAGGAIPFPGLIAEADGFDMS